MHPTPGHDDPNQDPGAVGHGDPQDPNAPAYDPGAAYVDENQTYAAADPTAYDPASAHYDPGSLPPGASSPEPYAYGEVEEVPAPAPAPVVRPASPKKKAVRRAPARKAVAKKPRRPAPKPTSYDGGLSFGTVLLGLISLGMVAVVVMIALPKDLSAVAGYPGDALDSASPRHLLTEAQNAMVSRDVELVFSEEEVNRYLRHRLTGEQKGLLASLVSFRGVCVDFSPQQAEVVIEREIFGLPLTVGVDLVAEEFRRQVTYKPVSWNLGRIELGKNAPKPVVDLFLRLRGGLLDEYQVLQQMPNVRFEEDRVVIDSRI